MSALSNQRVAYFNGKIVPEREVVIPFRDRSFTKGDGVFDMTRSFNGRIFKIKEHIDRLYLSLRYTRIDCGLKPSEMIEISEDVLDRNRHLLGKDDRFVLGVAAALEAGRPTEGETQEEAGFRQAHKIIELFDEHH